MNHNYYTIRSSNGVAINVLRGDEAPKMTGGGGGWQTIARPRRVGVTVWTGREPYQMDVSVLFDGWADNDSQEDQIRALNQMQMGGDLKEPPTIEIDGGVPVSGAKWVMTIDWGDDVIWQVGQGGAMYRTRQDAVLHLTQYNAQDELKVKGGGNLQTPRRYTVRKGDDLRSISQHMYGTPNRWKEIQSANNLRDPKKITTLVGKEIKIP